MPKKEAMTIKKPTNIMVYAYSDSIIVRVAKINFISEIKKKNSRPFYNTLVIWYLQYRQQGKKKK